MATKPRGGGTNGLSGRATKKITFFAASLKPDCNFLVTIMRLPESIITLLAG